MNGKVTPMQQPDPRLPKAVQLSQPREFSPFEFLLGIQEFMQKQPLPFHEHTAIQGGFSSMHEFVNSYFKFKSEYEKLKKDWEESQKKTENQKVPSESVAPK